LINELGIKNNHHYCDTGCGGVDLSTIHQICKKERKRPGRLTHCNKLGAEYPG
jgi:hypothetical protein